MNKLEKANDKVIEGMVEKSIREGVSAISIAGPTGSGKTTIAKKLMSKFDAVTFDLDDYFLDENELEMAIEQLSVRQWDTPSCYDWNCIVKNLTDFLKGKLINVPIRPRSLHRRIGWHRNLYKEESQLLVIDGLYALDERVLAVISLMRMSYLGIYLNIPAEERWKRKYARDVYERNEDPANLRKWFDEVIIPAENEHSYKQMKNAHIII